MKRLLDHYGIAVLLLGALWLYAQPARGEVRYWHPAQPRVFDTTAQGLQSGDVLVVCGTHGPAPYPVLRINSPGVTVTGNCGHENGGRGELRKANFEVRPGGDGATVEDLTVSGNLAGNGLRVVAPGVTVRRNTFEYARVCIRKGKSRVEGLTIEGNICRHAAQGIEMGSSPGYEPEDLTITGNTIYDIQAVYGAEDHEGIGLQGCIGVCDLSLNTIYDTPYGIALYAGSNRPMDNVSVTHNRIMVRGGRDGWRARGIQWVSNPVGDGHKIAWNQIYGDDDADAFGFAVRMKCAAGATDCTVHDNESCGNAGFLLNGESVSGQFGNVALEDCSQ